MKDYNTIFRKFITVIVINVNVIYNWFYIENGFHNLNQEV